MKNTIRLVIPVAAPVDCDDRNGSSAEPKPVRESGMTVPGLK